MGEGNTGKDNKVAPIDPLIAEMTQVTKLSCGVALSTLGIPLMTELEGEPTVSPELSTAQALLIRPYELAIPAVLGVPPEALPAHQEQERLLEHPQAFVVATVGVLQAFYEKQLREDRIPQPSEPVEPITVQSALAIGTLFANPNKLPEKSQAAAHKILDANPAAGVVFKGLQALQTPITPVK